MGITLGLLKLAGGERRKSPGVFHKEDHDKKEGRVEGKNTLSSREKSKQHKGWGLTKDKNAGKRRRAWAVVERGKKERGNYLSGVKEYQVKTKSRDKEKAEAR